jgi:hypothetical protein
MDSYVEALVGSGRNGAADGSTKRVDHGGSPAKREPKARRLGSPGQPKRRTSLKSTPVHEDRCCNCTIQSKCKTKGCDCFSANRPCTSCLNFTNCCNTEVPKQSYCKPTAAIKPVNDESQAPVIATILTAAKCETDDRSSNKTERESVEDD